MKLARMLAGTAFISFGLYALPTSAQALDPEIQDISSERFSHHIEGQRGEERHNNFNTKDLLPSQNRSVLADASSEGNQDSVNEDLAVSHRIGIGYSSSGAGFDGFGRFEGFIPLWQELGESVVFLETRLLLDNDADLGGNFLLGGRVYQPDRNQILGGYGSFDSRSTGETTFYQVGFGFERLSNWDLRVNGYVPVGDTSQTTEDTGFVDSGASSSSGFAGRQLVLTNAIESTRFLRKDVALAGFDLEAGGTFARWSKGDIRAYAGTYMYQGEDVPTTFGWRVRLDARPQPNLVLGLSVQGDDLFGTNVVATVGVTFPGVRPRRELDEKETILARLGEPVIRNNAITIDKRSETETRVRTESAPLENPEEEAPYRFTHVRLGASGGDGTYENPFGTVAEALEATERDGNDIVYVDGETQVDRIPAFEIPTNVSVLSQGPRQFLAGLPFPGFPTGNVRLPFTTGANFPNGILVELPDSGDGFFPTIADEGAQDLVTLGSNTVLAGFQLEDAEVNAIRGNGVSNIELRNNAISWSSSTNNANGILLEDVVGSAILFDNSITGAGERGISIQNLSVTDQIGVAIAGYQLERNSVGLEFIAENLGNQSVNIGPSSSTNTSIGVASGNTINNEITGSTDVGLRVLSNNLGTQSLTLDRGSITNNGVGIEISANVSLDQSVRITNSTISDNSGIGIDINGNNTVSTQEISILDRTIISNNGSDGINIEGTGTSLQGFTIADSTIRDNGGAGIRSLAVGNSQQEFNPETGGVDLGIGRNVITGNNEEGIILSVGDGSGESTLFAEIESNRLEDNNQMGGSGNDIVVSALDDIANACTFIVGNTVPAGISLSRPATSSGVFQVQDLPNFFAGGPSVGLSPTNGFAPVTLTPAISDFTTPAVDGTCFDD